MQHTVVLSAISKASSFNEIIYVKIENWENVLTQSAWHLTKHHFAHCKSNIAWTGIEYGSLRWEAGDKSPEPRDARILVVRG
jgi:hypothetical protein